MGNGPHARRYPVRYRVLLWAGPPSTPITLAHDFGGKSSVMSNSKLQVVATSSLFHTVLSSSFWCSTRRYFVNHNDQTTSWVDPRIQKVDTRAPRQRAYTFGEADSGCVPLDGIFLFLFILALFPATHPTSLAWCMCVASKHFRPRCPCTTCPWCPRTSLSTVCPCTSLLVHGAIASPCL
jgi:hypothetical protein